RLGHLFIDFQTLPNRLLFVVVPLKEFPPAAVANPLFLWRSKQKVVTLIAVLALPPAGEPSYQLFLIHLDIDDPIEPAIFSLQTLLQGLGLGHRSGKTV